MAMQSRLRLPDDVLVEMTRRSTSEDHAWARYLLLLRAASSIIDQAPATAQQCQEFDILERLGDDLQELIETIHMLFPGGLKEAWWYYLPKRLRQEEKNGCD